jgi:DNA-binding GntR family transcriptional regulator
LATKHPLQTISVAEAATNRLRESLFDGQYVAGEEIKDTQIAEEYGIARPTARIAVQQLITEGMLVRDPGYSARVREFAPEQVHDIFRVRMLIELDAVRAIRATDAPLDEVKAAMDHFADFASSSASEIAEADAAFHLAVVVAGGSARLRSYFEALMHEIRLLIALPGRHYGRGETSYEEHAELFQMLQHDVPLTQLEQAWSAHIEDSRDFLVQHIALASSVTA